MMLMHADILRRLDALEARLRRAEAALGPATGVFSPPKTPPVSCTRCGVALGRTSGYVCPHSDCPTGLGGVGEPFNANKDFR